MDWDKAKRLCIIFLLVLNLILFWLNNMNSNTYTIKQDQEKAIFKVLSQNKISMYAPLPQSYRPMKELSLSGYVLDIRLFANAFFNTQKDPESLTKNVEFNRITYLFEDKSISIAAGGVLTCFDPGSYGELTKESAKKLCDDFLKKLGKSFSGFALDNSSSTAPGGYVFEYREVYKKSTIHSNYIIFTFQDTLTIECSYSTNSGYVGSPREICAADEALLCFMKDIKNRMPDREIIINKMDLVYYLPESSSDMSLAFKAIPCYRIYMNNVKEPVLINAYLNTWAN